MKVVILANGEFPTKKELIAELREAQFLAVCDGAVCHLEVLGIEPSIIIGDLDSISLELREKYAHKIVHIQEQESNDLSKAFFHCVGLGFDEFVILGATGKREDHTLGNISLLSCYARRCKEVVMKSDFGEFGIYSLPCVIPSLKGMQISLFCLDPKAKISSKNLKYPLDSLQLPLWANGTLNEALGSCFELEADSGTQVIVYKAF
ncbi:thiamine diphosphokinase [Helicobacter pametensis]|uniref:thiamine diphosphokinase n=1 Tax=Helicobacter pametensis TaxID=95149 RepID=UPI0004888A34|nr:thiamine diphosphokinase [Helicobacter pametensis]